MALRLSSLQAPAATSKRNSAPQPLLQPLDHFCLPVCCLFVFRLSYDLPIFGADLVSLPGVHLVCIDLQPAHSSQELGEEAEGLMRDVKRCGEGVRYLLGP